jgi:HD superfamily phosphohydrolase
MYYNDMVYGTVQIEQPVLLDLMQSQAMRRLHGVLQHGISGLIGVTTPITRFQHSVGVMLLVQQMGGNLEEQIAALLHDVSHTAFSHVVDYVFGGHDSQAYHEEIKEPFLAASDVPQLLEKHGYDWHDFLDDEQYPLLEQPSPHLCADRLDYFLRDSLGLSLATPAHIRFLLGHLTTHEGRIATDDVAAARWLGYTFMAADEASWANFQEVGLYELTARAIRRALDIGALQEKDLWGVDRVVWKQLQAIPDPDLQELLQLISPQTRFVWDEEHPTFVISTKLRSVDPDVVTDDGQTAPLSQLDFQFARQRRRYHAGKEGPWPMRVLRRSEEGEGSPAEPETDSPSHEDGRS